MNVRELKELVAGIPSHFDGDEVWSDHPDMQVMWGPIEEIVYPCIIPDCRRIVLIGTLKPN